MQVKQSNLIPPPPAPPKKIQAGDGAVPWSWILNKEVGPANFPADAHIIRCLAYS